LRGTGGGAFRRLYADFLELASEEIDGIADREAAIFEDVAGVAASAPPSS
jgi:hypothetical protein